jgi:hypothetical protein
MIAFMVTSALLQACYSLFCKNSGLIFRENTAIDLNTFINDDRERRSRRKAYDEDER